jgi:ubiquitin C-terminal hydrolase
VKLRSNKVEVGAPQVFTEIQLDVARFDNLIASMTAWGAMDHIEGGYTFEGEHRRTAAKGRTVIAELPIILTFHLRRSDWQDMRATKVAKRFSFPEELNMDAFCTIAALTSETRYNLYAVIVQQGEADEGHFWVFLKDGEVWVKFDNHQASATTFDEVRLAGIGNDLEYGSVYILMYTRVDSRDVLNGEPNFQIPADLLGPLPPPVSSWWD